MSQKVSVGQTRRVLERVNWRRVAANGTLGLIGLSVLSGCGSIEGSQDTRLSTIIAGCEQVSNKNGGGFKEDGRPNEQGVELFLEDCPEERFTLKSAERRNKAVITRVSFYFNTAWSPSQKAEGVTQAIVSKSNPDWKKDPWKHRVSEVKPITHWGRHKSKSGDWVYPGPTRSSIAAPFPGQEYPYPDDPPPAKTSSNNSRK